MTNQNTSNVTEKSQSYSGLEVALTTGSKRKQVLSNCLTVRVPGERSDVEVRLTLRQARALQKFLNSNLD
jgi:hypothetical protein